MMWYWESYELGPSPSGVGKEYAFIAKNAAGITVQRLVRHEPDAWADEEMVWTIRTFIKSMLHEIEGLKS